MVKLKEVSKLMLEGGNARAFILDNEDFISTVIPTDFIGLFDELVKEAYPIEDLKALSNKVLNIFHLAIKNHIRVRPRPESFLGVLEQNNSEMEQVLDGIRPVFKKFVKDHDNSALHAELLERFSKLEVFVKHYTIKENVLFPILEKKWEAYRCLQIMWSFHDEIRQNIKTVIGQLSRGRIEFRQFNRCVGDIYFQMLAIRFREECILFPHIASTISEEEEEGMNREGFEMAYPYFQPPEPEADLKNSVSQKSLASLGTGELTVEQIRLIFNHLPVDITYVDEDNRVRYFSTPKKRIFPRTTAVLGREVKNCHPPESVHVVEQIVESFRKGEKSSADFWIHMKGDMIFIQYFAVRDEQGAYRGVIEVSQEITDIRALEGEKRLLDW